MNLLRFPGQGFAALLLMLFATTLSAQSSSTPRQTALRYLQENPAKFGLSASDVADVRVTDEYLSKNNGITHVWVQQQYAGVPVFNGLFGLHVKPDGKVATLGHRFIPGLASKVNTTLPSLSAAKAVEMAAANLGFTDITAPSVRQKIDDRNWVFEGGAISNTDIPVSICYELQHDGSVRLAWTMIIEQANSDAADVWNMRVDAQTGLILGKINQTVHCKAGGVYSPGEDCDVALSKNDQPTVLNKQESDLLVDESYNVFALPTESPIHGPRQLVVNPADPAASPYGWHDTNGFAGAEYTYTRGNNVYAYDDRDNNDTPPTTPFPNAGPSLLFDYPFDINNEPLDNLNAAIVNLFYMNNKMHDIFYRYGFDEQAGNFQQNNYGNGGTANELTTTVISESQPDWFTKVNFFVKPAFIH